VLYTSFETFVRGFSESHKINLVLAPTGSGKTTCFIAEMVKKFPKNMIVLCLPRRLACNVAVYLRTKYKLIVAVRNGEIRESVDEKTSVLIMTYQSAINAVISEMIHVFRSGRKISFVFDECHETCPEARRLYRLFRVLYNVKPDWIHSLFCVSATMDPVELSKRLEIEQESIETSTIEAPPKTFERGQTHVNPISVVDDEEDEEDADKKPKKAQKAQKAQKTQKADEKDDEEEEEKPKEKNDDPHIQRYIKIYLRKFVNKVLESLKEATMSVDESTVIIVDGIYSANRLIDSFRKYMKTMKQTNVIIWNTFVEKECPDVDLSTCHLIIVGSHMKLSSSITFPNCTNLHISYIMQIATSNLFNATVKLVRGLVPKSVEEQCKGRANRNKGSEVHEYPILFPSGFQNTREEYLKQDDVSKFSSDYIDVSINKCGDDNAIFCEKYNMSMKKAKSFFFSQAPIELLLSLHRCSIIIKDSKDKNRDSINIIRALMHTITYFSNPSNRVMKPPKYSEVSDFNFSLVVGQFILYVLNIVCDIPIKDKDTEHKKWEERLGDIKIKSIFGDIQESIRNDGLGNFSFSDGPIDQITMNTINTCLRDLSKMDRVLLNFFVKHPSNVVFAECDGSDLGSVDSIGLESIVLVPFGLIISAIGYYLFPEFILEYAKTSAKPEQPQSPVQPQPSQSPVQQQRLPQRPCASGGNHVQQKPQQRPVQQQTPQSPVQQQPPPRPCASGGNHVQQKPQQSPVQQQPQQRPVQQQPPPRTCASGGNPVQQQPQPQRPVQPQSPQSPVQQQPPSRPCASGGNHVQQRPKKK